jgi:pSer/pThr/pTyr-binding forkhead associated (FHA) protein
MDCEICKSSFPFTIGSNDKDLELFKIDKPTAPFIVLEAVGSDRNSNRGVHVISISNDNSITLGRGHDADVRISDISVSRCHANVKFKDGSFIIEDNNSKFGTLIKSSGKLVVQNSGALVLQAGRTVLSMSTKNNSNDLPDLH